MTGVPGVSGVIRSLSEPVLLIDPDGRVLDANPPAVRMLGPDVGGPDALLSDLLAAAPEDVAAFVSRAGASTSPTFAGFAARAARLGYLRLEGVRVMAPSAEPALVMVRCRERTAAASRFVELNDRVDLLSRALVESRRLEYELRGVTDELRERLEQLRRAEAASRRRAAETRRLAAEQSALRQVAMLAAADTPPAAVFAAVAREAARVVDADLGAVVRFDDEDEGAGRVVGIWTNGVLRVPVRDLTVPLAGTGLSARVRRSGETVDIPDYAEVDPETRRKVPHGLSTGVAAPVIVDSGVWGAIVVARGRLRPFSAVARQRMERFADTTSVAVASAQNRERLAMLASTDDLTGLLNRRAFQERVAAEFERALRHGRPVSLVVVDIDHFTLVNDTHGHGVGDRVLVDVARRLVALARPGEVVARIGGEEFAVLLPECDGDEGFAVAERVRAAINAVAFPGVGRLTSSAGLCDAAEARRPADLLRLADVALYWAKHQGRNRSFRYSQSALELLSAEEQDRRLTRARTLASITALAVAVDAKDSYTQRHSERSRTLRYGWRRSWGGTGSGSPSCIRRRWCMTSARSGCATQCC